MACVVPPVVDTDKNDAAKHTEALLLLLQLRIDVPLLQALLVCWLCLGYERSCACSGRTCSGVSTLRVTSDSGTSFRNIPASPRVNAS